MPNIYIIAGPNGAGKTTSSLTTLPQMLNCEEFVNADHIAYGLSPFHPEKVSIKAGKIMLNRIEELIESRVDFAIESTLSSKSYLKLLKRVKKLGYKTHLCFLWLSSLEIAKKRVEMRVSKGGHNIPAEIIQRRYFRGLFNLVNFYLSEFDCWTIINNETFPVQIIAFKNFQGEEEVKNEEIWKKILKDKKL